MRLLAFLLVLLLSTDVFAQGRLIPNPIRNIPRWVRTDFASRGLGRQYDIIYKLYPHTLRGDFNGDGRKDVVIQIQEKSSGKLGLAIFHAKRPQALSIPVTILGAGKSFGKATDDFKWVTVWSLIQRRQANEQMRSVGKPGFDGDVVKIEKRDTSGASGGLVYWDGKQYTWLPQILATGSE